MHLRTIMKQFVFFLILFFSIHATAQLIPDTSKWELSFSDEFDSVYSYPYIIDTVKWSRYFPFSQSSIPPTCNCKTDANTHVVTCDTLGKTYFTQWNDLPGSNLRIDTSGTGTLKIIARKQDFSAITSSYLKCGSPDCDVNRKCYWNARTRDSICTNHDTVLFNYTTAMLYSRQKFKYGYFELKYKIPEIPIPPATNSGFTIDWWLWHRDGSESNEIDMFEIRAKDNLYTTNVHYKRDDAGTDLAGKTYYHPEKLDGNWHISGLEWGPDRIDFYLDGEKIHSYPYHPESMIPMPMIIDLVPNALNFCNGVDALHTVFPLELDVDYVRVYKLK